jgi:hypothetical protein
MIASCGWGPSLFGWIRLRPLCVDRLQRYPIGELDRAIAASPYVWPFRPTESPILFLTFAIFFRPIERQNRPLLSEQNFHEVIDPLPLEGEICLW